MKTARHVRKAIVSLAAVLVLTTGPSANAITYEVNRSWDDIFGTGSASLVGTLDVALGNYSITNGGPAPFTNINLVLTVNGTSVVLDQADTAGIQGAGTFLVNATASALIFDVANADGQIRRL